jgi:hypothetical protein
MELKEIRNFLIAVVFIFAMFMALGSGSSQSILKITGAEMNQTLGVQKDSHQYYVAGKNTVVRAFLNKSVTVNPDTTGVSVYKSGQHVFNMAPKIIDSSVSSVDFLCPSLKDCQNWAAGSYSFEMSVNGTDYSLSGPYSFVAGDALRILAVPVKANYGSGGIKYVTGDTWKKLGQFTQNVYPLAEDNLKWTNRLKFLDATSFEYNIETDAGQDNLTAALNNLIPASCKTSPNDAGCYDYVVGMIPETVNSLEGWAPMGLPVVVVVAGSDDAAGTVAHEIAHKFGIGDTYDDATGSSIMCSVNPAPDGFKGRDWDNNFQTFDGCTAGRPASTLTGANESVINGAQVEPSAHAYEWSRGYLAEKADFMSGGGAYQTQLWITPDNYDWLYRKLVSKDPTIRAASFIRSETETENRFVSFSGLITKDDDVELDAWETYMDAASMSDNEGTYMVQAVNASNAVLAHSAFTVQFFNLQPPREVNIVHFSGVVNFPVGTTKFQVVKDGAVLEEVSVSASAPVVSSVAPQTSTSIDSSYTITWSANDSETTSLTYTISYNSDVTDSESPWIILADGLETKSWEEDFGLLPGGSHARIRVTASDGVLCGSAESALFSVPLKAPEVFINEQTAEDDYTENSGITLSADVFDLQDDPFNMEKIKWTSNIEGDLGTGTEILVKDLPAGLNIITVTATNSAGLSNSDSVSIEVAEDADHSGGNGLCFIATASSGDSLHHEGLLKSVFREVFSLKGRIGLAAAGCIRWLFNTF